MQSEQEQIELLQQNAFFMNIIKELEYDPIIVSNYSTFWKELGSFRTLAGIFVFPLFCNTYNIRSCPSDPWRAHINEKSIYFFKKDSIAHILCTAIEYPSPEGMLHLSNILRTLKHYTYHNS